MSSTHLVKGLDFKLLEKVRRGEDVMRAIRDDGSDEEEAGQNSGDEEDVLDKVLERDIVPEKKEEKKKKGNLAPKTRAEILAELKRSREAAKPVSVLGSKFKKIGVKEDKKDENGAKVKYVTGADGRVKKMVKKDKKKSDEPKPVSTRIMGMIPPPPMPGKTEKKAEEEDEDVDIFEGAGTEYNPLAGLGDDDDDSSSSSSEEGGEEGEIHPTKRAKSEKAPGPSSKSSPPPISPSASMPPPPPPPPPSASKPKVNYFNEPASSAPSSDTYKPPSSASALLSSNPELAAALAKASTLKVFSTPSEDEAEKRRKALMEAADRDAFDIDFGFGGSRDFGDEDDDDGTVAKSGGGGGKKRKRGGKPKKGDKNDAGVVGKIVEERYGGGSRK